MIKIGRAINGISINSLEYLLTEDKKNLMLFETKEKAIEFLKSKGLTDEYIEELYFQEEIKKGDK
jgi:hypothetical protein